MTAESDRREIEAARAAARADHAAAPPPPLSSAQLDWLNTVLGPSIREARRRHDEGRSSDVSTVPTGRRSGRRRRS